MVLVASPVAGQAQTLRDALVQTYQNNGTLQAARANAIASSEEISQAVSNFRPSLTLQGQVERTRIETDTSTVVGSPKSGQVVIDQPIFRGGSNFAAYRKSKANVLASYAALHQQEQAVINDALTAYMDLVRDKTIVNLRRNNTKVLARQLDETEIRFGVGETSKTDVAQAKSRLALAESGKVEAVGDLEVTKAKYQQVIGPLPRKLREPRALDHSDKTLQQVLEVAVNQSPAVIKAKFLEESSQGEIDENFGKILPQVSLKGTATKAEDNFGFASAGNDSETLSVMAQVSVPFYQGGAQASRIRQAKKTASQRRVEVEQTKREVREQATQAWQAYKTDVALIDSLTLQVKAAQIALEGVRIEQKEGVRTTLDVLDAEQELLQARSDLISARRDLVLSSYGILAAMGKLTAKDLKLNVDLFDTQSVFNETKGQWWGF